MKSILENIADFDLLDWPIFWFYVKSKWQKKYVISTLCGLCTLVPRSTIVSFSHQDSLLWSRTISLRFWYVVFVNLVLNKISWIKKIFPWDPGNIILDSIWKLYQLILWQNNPSSVGIKNLPNMILSTSIYDLVLIYVCHFHHHHHPLTFPQILLISSCKPSYSSWTIEILVLTSWIPASKNFDIWCISSCRTLVKFSFTWNLNTYSEWPIRQFNSQDRWMRFLAIIIAHAINLDIDIVPNDAGNFSN